jgi:chorismate mutase
MSERVRALRGAITVDENDEAQILAATTELVSTLIARNGLAHDDIVSCLFTCTDDLNAQFPAVAARELGLNSVPLICAREIDVPGAMQRVIRVLMHCYPAGDVQHVYLGEAKALRADLEAAQ